jgi:hypothetical protein
LTRLRPPLHLPLPHPLTMVGMMPMPGITRRRRRHRRSKSRAVGTRPSRSSMWARRLLRRPRLPRARVRLVDWRAMQTLKNVSNYCNKYSFSPHDQISLWLEYFSIFSQQTNCKKLCF